MSTTAVKPEFYKPHPIANLWPLKKEDIAEIQDDIKENGQVSAITLWEHNGKKWLLDGRRRQIAMTRLRLEPKYEVFEGTEVEALAYARSKNSVRRHETDDDRAMTAAKVANFKLGTNQHTKPKAEDAPEGTSADVPSLPSLPIEQAAEMFDVSRSSVERARSVLENGTPELQKALEEGKVSLTDAARTARATPAQQARAVARVVSGKARTASESIPVREKKPSANGKPKFDDRKIPKAYGQLLRLLDARKKAFPCPEAGETIKAAEALLASWKRWQKATAS